MRKFVSNLPTKEVDFMGDKITIRKISAGAVKRIGQTSQKLQEKGQDADTLTVLVSILQEGVVLGKDDEAITTDLLEEFPIDELNALSSAIMEYGGVPVGNEGNAGS
jgi:hypothetical protein